MMAADLRVTAAGAALTISLATVGLAVTVLPWSFLADRIGRVRAMMWGICAATALGLLVPLASSFPLLLGLRMLEGMALGGIPAIAIAYLNEEVNKAHAAMAAGSYVAGTTLGGLAGRLIAGVVGELWGWRAGALAVSIVAAAAAALFLVLVPQARGFAAAPAGGFRGALADPGRARPESAAAGPVPPGLPADGRLCGRLQLPRLPPLRRALQPAGHRHQPDLPGLPLRNGLLPLGRRADRCGSAGATS